MVTNDKDKKEQEIPEVPEALKDFLKKLGNVSFSAEPSAREPTETEADEKEEESVKQDPIKDFNFTPREVKAYLDRFVIRQHEAKKALSIAVCDHYNHARQLRLQQSGGAQTADFEFQKQNILVSGPTGVGKTYLIKHVAELLGVPFVKADATKFSETGYVGGDVDDLVRELVQRANGDTALAECGIIYIDEIDKLAGKSSLGSRDVSGRGVQTTLLKLMEETEVAARNPMDMRGQMQAVMDLRSSKKKQKDTINTRHILFIVSGAFSGLEKIVDARTRSSQMGFQAQQLSAEESKSLLEQATTQDFIDYGFEAEFIGRLPVRVFCQDLEAKDLVKILKESEGSLLHQYEREFEAYGIRSSFDQSAIELIAQLASEEKTGARALMTVCEKLLRDFKYELPGSQATELNITSELLENPERFLEENRGTASGLALERTQKELVTFANDFREKHNISLTFSEDAVARLTKESEEESQTVLQICRRRFSEFEFALKIVERNTGQNSFQLSERDVADPDSFLTRLVTESYSDDRSTPERDADTVD